MDAFQQERESFAANAYHNAVQTDVPAATLDPDAEFARQASRILQLTCDLARELVSAHQAAVALIVADDWPTARKYFSLSEKYAAWCDYNAAAKGIGVHEVIVRTNQPLRLTQLELEAHPDWRGFGTEAGKHPPMRGWLAVPLIGDDGNNYGLLQVSDRYEGDFTAEDETDLLRLGQLCALALDGIRELRAARKTEQSPVQASATLAAGMGSSAAVGEE